MVWLIASIVKLSSLLSNIGAQIFHVFSSSQRSGQILFRIFPHLEAAANSEMVLGSPDKKRVSRQTGDGTKIQHFHIRHHVPYLGHLVKLVDGSQPGNRGGLNFYRHRPPWRGRVPHRALCHPAGKFWTRAEQEVKEGPIYRRIVCIMVISQELSEKRLSATWQRARSCHERSEEGGAALNGLEM